MQKQIFLNLTLYFFNYETKQTPHQNYSMREKKRENNKDLKDTPENYEKMLIKYQEIIKEKVFKTIIIPGDPFNTRFFIPADKDPEIVIANYMESRRNK